MLLGVMGLVAQLAFKRTTASSFIHHRTASNNNRTLIDHVHVSGTLRMQHFFSLAVQLWASY